MPSTCPRGDDLLTAYARAIDSLSVVDTAEVKGVRSLEAIFPGLLQHRRQERRAELCCEFFGLNCRNNADCISDDRLIFFYEILAIIGS